MKFLVVIAAVLAAASAGHIAPIGPVVYGAQHLPVIGPNGVPIDTPEVQHATAAHLAHKAEAHPRNGDYIAPVVAGPVVAAPFAHAGPAAYPTTHVHPASLNGVPLETPEVVAAKSEHFAAHAEALARNAHGHHHLHRRGIYTPYAFGAYTYGAYPYAAPYAGYPYHY